jgi:excisionase family DNA binding protein
MKRGIAMETPLLRVHEAAGLLKVSKWTIYRWIEEGRLAATKIGRGSLRVFRASVDVLTKRNRTDSYGAMASSCGNVVRLPTVGTRIKR